MSIISVPQFKDPAPDTDLSPLSETVCLADHCMTVTEELHVLVAPCNSQHGLPFASLQVNSVTKLERHARNDEREACWSSRLFRGAGELVAPVL